MKFVSETSTEISSFQLSVEIKASIIGNEEFFDSFRPQVLQRSRSVREMLSGVQNVFRAQKGSMRDLSRWLATGGGRVSPGVSRRILQVQLRLPEVSPLLSHVQRYAEWERADMRDRSSKYWTSARVVIPGESLSRFHPRNSSIPIYSYIFHCSPSKLWSTAGNESIRTLTLQSSKSVC